MIKANQITKNVLDIQKGTFASWYSSVSFMQDQTALAVDTMLDQASWIPAEGRQAILSWVSVCKDGSERYKKYVEEGFSGLEKYIAKEIKPSAGKKKAAPAKPKKIAVETKSAAPPKPQKPAVEEKPASPATTDKPA